MILDEVKLASDDSYFTEDHVVFLIGKYRAHILSKEVEKVSKKSSSSNFQEICLDLIQVPAICGDPCEDGPYLRSVHKIPGIISEETAIIYPRDFYYFNGNFQFVSKERMRFTGHNRYTKNFIYASKGPDGYLYFKSSNPQFLYVEKITMHAMFEEWEKAVPLYCSEDKCHWRKDRCKVEDLLEEDFPLDSMYIPILVEACVKELLGASYRPKDNLNNAADDLADLIKYLRLNTKSDLQKKLEND